MIKKFSKISESNEILENTDGKYKVIFDGFETEQQAVEFANWYSGSGEQESGLWLEEHTDLKAAYVDMTKLEGDARKTFKVENNEVKVPLKLYKKK